jgi:hypothetical protein
LTTFKDKLAERLGSVYEFVKLENANPSKQKVVLVPLQYRHVPVTMILDETESSEDMMGTQASTTSTASSIGSAKARIDEEDFLHFIHVALKLHGDILAHPKFTGVDVSEDGAVDTVPQSLYIILDLLFGGLGLLETALEDSLTEDGNGDSDEEDKDRKARASELRQTRILSIAQDIVAQVTGNITPKQLGLASTLHQATRNRDLVDIFHRAGQHAR